MMFLFLSVLWRMWSIELGQTLLGQVQCTRKYDAEIRRERGSVDGFQTARDGIGSVQTSSDFFVGVLFGS